MRRRSRPLVRSLAVVGLVAGGLALPGGSAEAAACSGSTGVTVVITNGGSTSTLCAPGDPSSAMSALKAVATVVSPQRYPGSVVCRINGAPASDPCVQMPPGDAYWAFYHAPRGGSWTYSQVGVAGYDPAPGTVVGFAFGNGARPGVNPPAAPPKSTPKPKPKPSPSSSSSKPPAPKPSSKPAGTTPARPGSSGSSSSGSGTSVGSGSGSAAAGSSASATTTPGAVTSTTAPGATSSTTGSDATTPSTDTTSSGEALAAADAPPGSGTPTTLLAGLGLVGLVGAGAAYLAVRRRATS